MTSGLLEKQNIAETNREEDVRQYLKEIRSYPLLTPEQERQLAMECAQGSEEAIRTMVNSNLRLVVSIAREYAGRGVPLLDLIQEGSIGLLTAARKFDYTMDCRFSTYASRWIRQGVSRCIMDDAGVIRVPRYTMERMRKLLAAKAAMQQEGLEPETRELAKRSDIPEEKVQQLLDLMPQVCSLDAPAGDGENDALQTLVENLQAIQPHQELVRRELEHSLDTLLGMLEPRQRQILRLHFGMEDGICHSLAEIGKMLDISKERARQIEYQAMDKLRTMGADLGLEDFLQ